VANYGPDDVGFILVGGYNLLGDTVEITDKIAALTDESHALGDSWHEHAYLGLKRAELTQKGYFNDASDGLNAALVGGMGTSHVLSYGVEGNTVGKKFIGYTGALQIDYDRIASLKALHRANAKYHGNGQVDTNGVILHALGARTTDGNSEGADSVDNGSSSAGGGVAYLHVVAYSGFTNVVFKVRHSSDDSTYADLITFSTVTAIGAERSTTAVTVNRHLAVDWNVTGTGSVTFMVGFKRNA
jgi:hypothetical protein